MRPVNLIPSDDRRGADSRTGRSRASYVAIGALVAILAGVTAMVTTNRQIADREAELVALEQRQQEAAAKIQSYQAFASLRTVADLRVATVKSLAQSRFDWERVMRELSRILPSDVWLVSLSGTVRPDLKLEGGVSIPTRGTVPGPALEMLGCAKSQDAVARFTADLKDIDGVTRVGVFESKRPELSTSSSTSQTAGPGGDCRSEDTETQFRIVAAFDRVAAPQIPQAAPDAGTVPPAQTAPQGPDSESLASAKTQKAEAVNSTEVQTEKARNATNLVPK